MGAASTAQAGEKIPSIFRLWRVPCVATARGWEEAFAGCSVMFVSLYAEQASEMTCLCAHTAPPVNRPSSSGTLLLQYRF